METSNPASGFPPTYGRAPVRPRIIPVLDVMGGQVVRAVGGRRSEYRPVRSVLTDSTEPGEVARALVTATRATRLYVADLDAIIHGQQDVASVRATASAGVPVICDGGFRTVAEAAVLAKSDVFCVVGTETGNLALVAQISQWRCGVSLDLRESRVVGDPAVWGGTSDPILVATRAVDAGAETLIVLDLARVGTGTGPGTEQLLSTLKHSFPKVDVLAGGGVRTWADVERLTSAGADAVLVASALHDGTVGIR
jgi:phosphoribosylformimino-5-aminoimidazole carboxamide ribotide isomerase